MIRNAGERHFTGNAGHGGASWEGVARVARAMTGGMIRCEK
jgi:hypothetical protein